MLLTLAVIGEAPKLTSPSNAGTGPIAGPGQPILSAQQQMHKQAMLSNACGLAFVPCTQAASRPATCRTMDVT